MNVLPQPKIFYRSATCATCDKFNVWPLLYWFHGIFVFLGIFSRVFHWNLSRNSLFIGYNVFGAFLTGFLMISAWNSFFIVSLSLCRVGGDKFSGVSVYLPCPAQCCPVLLSTTLPSTAQYCPAQCCLHHRHKTPEFQTCPDRMRNTIFR